MSRLEITRASSAEQLIDNLYQEVQRRLAASPPGLCPIDLSLAFIQLCHAQTCGKCAPCHLGLNQLKFLLQEVIDGKGSIESLALIQECALAISDSADCQIGVEAAQLVLKGLVGFQEDYLSHIHHQRCASEHKLNIPCISKCPANVDVPGYISLIKKHDYRGAINLIRKDNPFPTTCSYICEHPCEKYCRRSMIDDAINIRGLKRYACDQVFEYDKFPMNPSTNKKVAVVGGGPGGLTSAYYLQLMGHQVTVFEMGDDLGGMLRYGIPNYRLPKERLAQDINAILETGIQVHLNTKIGVDYSFEDLAKHYDATLIAIGASTGKALGLENEEHPEVISAVEFLKNAETKDYFNFVDKDIIVIGGGNVAMDAVRSAKRLGACSASVVYRRQQSDMTALKEEIEGALCEGCELLTLYAPKNIVVTQEGRLSGLEVQRQMVSNIKGGRVSVTNSELPSHTLKADYIITAIGQDIESEYFNALGIKTKYKKFVTDRYAGIEDLPGVFAIGDCSSGPATVISAIAEAKVSAANIDAYLGFNHQIKTDVEVDKAPVQNIHSCGRVNLLHRQANERDLDFLEVEQCFGAKEAQQEASRCLRCDCYGYGIFKGGRVNQW